MKIVLKYVWSLALIPFLVFLKGDLNVETFMHVNDITPLETARTEVMAKLDPKPIPTISFPVKVVNTNKGFSADGLIVDLYDENYNLLCRSQVLRGYVRFQFKGALDSTRYLSAVVPKTSDELSITPTSSGTDTLVIHEAFLREEE